MPSFLRTPAPDPVAVAVLLDDTGRATRAGCRPAIAHVFQHAAHPRDELVLGEAVQGMVELLLDIFALDRGPGIEGERCRAARVHEDGQRPGLFQGAADARLQTELQSGVEQQSSPDGRSAAWRYPSARRLPERRGTRRDRRSPAATAGSAWPGRRRPARARRRPVRSRLTVRRSPTASRSTARRVRTCERPGHESGSMRGVLDAVGEDQRLLLGGVERGGSEEGGQAHRQQGGDRRCRGSGCRRLAGSSGRRRRATGRRRRAREVSAPGEAGPGELSLVVGLRGLASPVAWPVTSSQERPSIDPGIGLLQRLAGGVDQGPEATFASGVVGADVGSGRAGRSVPVWASSTPHPERPQWRQ